MVPFAGFDMPVQYPSGITSEHKSVRDSVALFDVSHMGEFMIRGSQAIEFANYVTTNDVAALSVGQAQYSTILNERGTIVDDCLVYRFPDHLMMVVNASNKDKDMAHISAFLDRFDCAVEDVSDRIALLALQGPRAQEVMARHTDVRLDDIAYYHFMLATVAGVPDVILSRTGYTGEDGFELYFDASRATEIWNALTADGSVVPAGLGARDTLRLEMGMALYGNDIDDTTTPYEAGLGWLVKMKKGDFVGRDALERQKTAGIPRKLIGFTMPDRAFPRHGYAVFCNGESSGEVRSGTLSPSLGSAIGTAYLPFDLAKEGTEFEIEIRGKRFPALVQKMPFYKNASHR
ncbi:MAG: glycine cleavage system aminomethyltransferase GcvT [Gemmatimonadota bacterium]|nr:glycine cleavage system aminomethyltransferase GcvT [Gemmatimonadota bacterium]